MKVGIERPYWEINRTTRGEDHAASSMPLQNRVNPFGAIISSAARGTFMGNRGGALHNDKHEIRRQFKNRRWITCVLEFKGRKRSVMSPGRYTELFFLDEAVALAAGHRPCAECRRERFYGFRSAWISSHEGNRVPFADEIDAELHRTRIGGRGEKLTYVESLDSLPNGCFVEIERSAWLVWDQALVLWAPERYLRKDPRPSGLEVRVLTPEPSVRCLRQGYVPEIHNSLLAL